MTAKLDLSQFEGPAGTMVAQESVDLLLALAREQQEQIKTLRGGRLTASQLGALRIGIYILNSTTGKER